jgi:hypothetical protein
MASQMQVTALKWGDQVKQHLINNLKLTALNWADQVKQQLITISN